MNIKENIKTVCFQLKKIYSSKFFYLILSRDFKKINLPDCKNLDLSEKELEKQLSDLTGEYQKIINSDSFKTWQLFNKIKKNPKKYFKKAITVFKRGGLKDLSSEIYKHKELSNSLEKIDQDYQIWLKKNWPTKIILNNQRNTKFKYNPLISILVPTYNSNVDWLKKCFDSVLSQSYINWELCIADDNSIHKNIRNIIQRYAKIDSRIKYIFRNENGHISLCSNSALSISSGEFISLLDHDDELSPNALYEIVKVLNQNKRLDLIYSDEDKIDLVNKHVEPFFKPDWSPDMFLSMNYLCHLTTIRKSLIDKVGGFRKGYEGSQDYDLFLRITEITKRIYHIPAILYSWRKAPNSTAAEYSVKNYANQASINSLSDHLNRLEIPGLVENGIVGGSFRVKYNINGRPLVSIIIPTKDKVDYLKRCVNSIVDKTTYQNYEILIIDTGSIEPETTKYYQKINCKNIKILKWQGTFNYSAVNNFAAKKANGDYLLLLNNDTEIISPQWIESMLEHAQRNSIGAVGCKLLYPTKKIQHAGVILGIRGEKNKKKRGVAGHALKYFPDIPLQHPLLNSKDIVRDYSAVTAACIMIKKEKFNEVGGLDEKFRIAFNDVDFNLKLLKNGYYNVYTPYSVLYHHESVSVGTPERLNRDRKEFVKESKMMIEKWGETLENDKFYNINLTKYFENFGVKVD